MLASARTPMLPEQTSEPKGQTAVEKNSKSSANPLPTSSTSSTLVQEVEPSASQPAAESFKTIGEEFSEVKHSLRQLSSLIQRLGISLAGTGHVSSEDASVGDIIQGSETKKSVLDLPGTSKERNKNFRNKPARGKRFSKPFGSRRPSWSLKVLEPLNMQPVDSLGQIELKDSTLKCLRADGITEIGCIEKNVLRPLVSGDDVILQIRGNKMQDFCSYAIIDVLDQNSAEMQALVVMNRLGAQSSKSFLESLQKHIDVAELSISLKVIEDRADLEPLFKSTPNKPQVYVCTPETLVRLKAAKMLHPKWLHIMIVYEAEYVTRSAAHNEAIKSILDELDVCQVVMAAHDGTEDIVQAAELFDFQEEKVVFSMDRENITAADHYYYTENSMTEAIMTRAVQLSKEHNVVVICHDSTEANNMKNLLSERAEVFTITKVAESSSLPHGILVTPQIISSVLQNKPRTAVKMIFNLSGAALLPERYLDMMASYMDTGVKCEIVSKVATASGLKGFDSLGIPFQEITTEVPF